MRSVFFSLTALPVVFILFASWRAKLAAGTSGSIKIGPYTLERFDSNLNKATKNYKNAEADCQKRQGWLVRVKDKKMADAISSLLVGARTGYYIGLKYTGNKWKWNDGTAVNYTNWAEGQPDNEKHECVLIAEELRVEWIDVSCGGKKNYICQSGDPCLNYCENGGSCVVDDYYPYSPICSCTKEYKGSNCSVAVYGPPVIMKADVDKCSVDGRVNVVWKPDERSNSIQHRLEVTTLTGEDPDIVRNITPSDSVSQVTYLTHLLTNTTYIIKITGCPDTCWPMLEKSTQVTTGLGLPPAPGNVRFQQNGSICTFMGLYNQNAKIYNVTEFKITVTSSTRYVSPSVTLRNYSESITIESHPENTPALQTQPNRKYSGYLTSSNCAGPSPTVKVNGTCLTKRAAPDLVLVPNVTSSISGQRQLDIIFPDESNGTISCVFVVMKIGDDNNGPSPFTLANLSNAQAAAAEEPKPGGDYLSVAIQRLNTTGRTADVILGDDALTTCDLNEVYKARNWPLKTDITYSFYIITATPTEDEILLKTSTISSFLNTQPNADLNTQIGLAFGGVGILLLIIIAAIFSRHVFSKRRNRPIKAEDRQEISAEQQDVFYANLEPDSNKPTSETDILLHRLQGVYEALKAEGRMKFREEFQKLKCETNAINTPAEISLAPSLKKKNRYKNILPYESSRVVLDGVGDDTYINACFIDGYNAQNKFIATQGPLRGTVNDFWRMTVEQKCRVIVMLTRCIEKGKTKCEKYWPSVGEKQTKGDLTIINVAEENYGGFFKRSLQITARNKVEYTINQFHLVNWPDHGVPNTTSTFFRLHKAVVESQGTDEFSPPIIVHCSAGAGRTGTFIGYDISLNESEALKRVDVYNCVVAMRNQRVDMVQNLDQYVLLYQLLVENYLFGNTDVQASELNNISAKDLCARVEKEYRNLSVFEESKAGDERKAAPGDRRELALFYQPGDTEETTINATYVETYRNSLRLIAAQTPGLSMAEQFWNAAFDNDVTTIVMLNKRKGQKKYWPSVDQELQFGEITIKLNSEHAEKGIVERNFELSRDRQRKVIIQYQYTEWETASCPENPKRLADLISLLQAKIEAEKNVVTLVHCSDGTGRTGVMCAILNLIDRLKIEERVDVFRAVKDLRDVESEMVQNLDQYYFCYKVLQYYMETFNLYSSIQASSDTDPIYQNVEIDRA